MYLNDSSPTLTGVTFSGNGNTNGYGGGMSIRGFSNPTLTDVRFSGNSTFNNAGGGIYYDATPVSTPTTLTDVTFSGNTASSGGGMWSAGSNLTLTDVTFSGNTADYGGGMLLQFGSNLTLTDVTFSGNTANAGGGMYLFNSNPTLTNSIIWGNSPESIYLSSGTPIITYSDIEGGWEGEGNIDADPLFCDEENGDLTLAENSPCVGTGQDGADMGALGVGCEGEYECEVELADVNGDMQINILDLVQIANLILEVSTPAYECAADYNGDGQVNILDLVQIANCILDDCWETETVCDIDGNCYETIQIGEQLWMAENLKVTHYNDDSEIQYVQSESSEPDVWENLSTGAYAVYPADDDENSIATCGDDCADVYGNLYNWFAVDDSRGVCPDGWHVPSDEEFMELEMELGMSEEEANSTGFRGTDEGSKLAGNSDLWNDGVLENNSEFGTSGFNGLPAGYRYYDDGGYSNMGTSGSFWSSSEYDSSNAWGRGLGYSGSNVGRDYGNKRLGFSIRCLGD